MQRPLFFLLFLLIASFIPEEVDAQVYGKTLYNWDFHDGFPSDWTIESVSNIGQWEYRGPQTEPNNTVGSRGSCSADKSPVQSNTLGNGFVVFDSSFLDHDSGPCGNLGSGIDPAPHEAYFITAPFDLSTANNPFLTFQQKLKNYENTQTSVAISTDSGITFNTIHLNPYGGYYTTKNNMEWVSVDLKDYIGLSGLRLKFTFAGFYYWWQVDDITVYEAIDNNVQLYDSKYSNFNGTLDPIGMGGLSYSIYPTSMLPKLRASAKVRNVGGMPQQKVRVALDIQGPASISAKLLSNPVDTLKPNVSATFNFATYPITNTVGEYLLTYKASFNGEDQDSTNNSQIKQFAVHPYLFSRHWGVMEDQYFPKGELIGKAYEAGNAFVATEAGRQITGIEVALGDSTTVGSVIYAVLYDYRSDTLISRSSDYVVNPYDLNHIGEEKYVHLRFEPAINTEDSIAYFAMIGSYGSEGERMSIARTDVTPPGTTLIKFPEEGKSYYFLKTPMLNLKVFPSGVAPGCTDITAANYNASATAEDGSCRYEGCTDSSAENFNTEANWDDGSCIYLGCTDSMATNFDPKANEDDGSCLYSGCTDPEAVNYDELALDDDGSCRYGFARMSVDKILGCDSLTIVIKNLSNFSPEDQCLFVLGDGSIIDSCFTALSYTYEDAGDYQIAYTYTNAESSTMTTSDKIMVYPAQEIPELFFNAENNILNCSNCSDSLSFLWYLDKSPISDDSSQLAITESGDYELRTTNMGGCEALSENLEIILVSVDEYHQEKVFFYPNPAADHIYLTGLSGKEEVQILDVSGRIVIAHSGASLNGIIDISTLRSGTYFISIKKGNTIHTSKLIKRVE